MNEEKVEIPEWMNPYLTKMGVGGLKKEKLSKGGYIEILNILHEKKLLKSLEVHLELVRDCDCESPREWDNFSKIIMFGKYSRIGDKHEYDDPEEFLTDLLLQALDNGDDEKATELYESLTAETDSTDYGVVCDYLVDRGYILKQVYLLDHSGIRLSTASFNDPWDSGRVGWIYASPEMIRKNYSVEVITEKTIADAISEMDAEINVLDDYVAGNTYGFQLYEGENEIDSCYGFIGDIDDVRKAIKEHIPKEYWRLADDAKVA
jgi:hypothetical protein